MEIQIRPAQKKDLPFILKLLNHAILNTTAVYEDKVKDEAYVEQWWKQRLVHKKPIVVAERNGQLLGYGSFGQFRPRFGYRYCVEHSVYVLQDFQGQGIGRKLLLALIEIAETDGYKTMIAAIDAENKGSIQFHIKNGFRKVGHIENAAFKFNRWLDLMLLQLDLS